MNTTGQDRQGPRDNAALCSVRINDRPLMLSDLYLFIGIAAEAAREEGVPFEEMFAAVVMDELSPA